MCGGGGALQLQNVYGRRYSDDTTDQAAIGPYFPTLQIFWDFEAMAPLSRPNKTPRIATSSVANCDVTNGRFVRSRRAKNKNTANNVHQ